MTQIALESSKVLSGLADQYRKSKLGRTGESVNDFGIFFSKLLEEMGIRRSEDVQLAIDDLLAMERRGGLSLDRDPRNPSDLHRIRVSRIQENELFRALGEVSPKQERLALADLFESFVNAPIPHNFQNSWKFWCQIHAQNALVGKPLAAFSREKPEEIKEILDLIIRLFKWPHVSQLSLVSGVLCGDTSRIEKIHARLTKVLNIFTDGAIQSLDDFGIVLESSFCHFHGRVKLNINRTLVDFGGFRSGIRLEEVDIDSLKSVEVQSPRCIVVQKEATFFELVKLNCGDLLIHSGLPNEPTVKFISTLPMNLDFWYFGNSDAEGFHILKRLRESTGKPFQPLHMTYRRSKGNDTPLTISEKKLLESLLQSPIVQDVKPWIQDIMENNSNGLCEQETLGVPSLDWFPYFDLSQLQ